MKFCCASFPINISKVHHLQIFSSKQNKRPFEQCWLHLLHFFHHSYSVWVQLFSSECNEKKNKNYAVITKQSYSYRVVAFIIGNRNSLHSEICSANSWFIMLFIQYISISFVSFVSVCVYTVHAVYSSLIWTNTWFNRQIRYSFIFLGSGTRGDTIRDYNGEKKWSEPI